MKSLKLVYLFALSFMFLTSCDDDSVPPEENPEEVIDRVTLTFTPTSGGTAITSTAFDSDGDGPNEFAIDGLTLDADTEYKLFILVENTIEDENVSDEILKENDEHMFFFSFTDGVFSNPTGNGNIDNRADAINYDDEDADKFPLGLNTTWTTSATSSQSNTFRVVLKHQPNGLKTATSTASDGESDINLTWTLTIN